MQQIWLVYLATKLVAAVPQQHPTCAHVARGPVDELLRRTTAEALGIGGDARVAIRGLRNLPSGTSPLLPLEIHPPRGNATFPLLVEAIADAPLRDFGAAARAMVDQHLAKHGAVLFRGLPASKSEDLKAIVEAMGFTSVFIGGGGTARSVMSEGVRSASDEPADHTIEPHQDMAHNPIAPSKLAFLMLHGPPAGAGGQTVLTDMRAVTRDVAHSGILGAFDDRGGVSYVKTLWNRDSPAGANTSFTWQSRFFADEPSQVEDALRRLPTDRGPTTWRWDDDGTLHFESTLPACVRHSVTGETIFFNGIHTNHRDYFDLAPHIDTSIGTPHDTKFANGDLIPTDMLDHIRAIWWNNSVALALKSGDVALVDNVLAGHGRLAWTPGVLRQMLIAHIE